MAKFESLKSMVGALGREKLDKKIILTNAEPSGDVEVYERLKKPRGADEAPKGELLFTCAVEDFPAQALKVLGFDVEERENAGTGSEEDEEDSDKEPGGGSGED